MTLIAMAFWMFSPSEEQTFKVFYLVFSCTSNYTSFILDWVETNVLFRYPNIAPVRLFAWFDPFSGLCA